MPEFVVDLKSIIVEAKDCTEAREMVIQLIKESNGADVGIDQVIMLDEEE